MSVVEIIFTKYNITLNIKYNYITASQLKEILNVRSYCAKYYLLSDTKITQFLK